MTSSGEFGRKHQEHEPNPERWKEAKTENGLTGLNVVRLERYTGVVPLFVIVQFHC